jgi:CTP:molybdopterin cytidylyltransferase MocA
VITGLVLAAGAGTRFGGGSSGAGAEPGRRSKLLAELEGRPLLEHAVRAQSAVAALERIVVVLGAFADEVLARVDFGRAEPVICEEWEAGQAASLRCGLRALAGASRVIVTLGDAPLVTPDVIALFVSAEPGTRAVYHGRPGHPVVLGAQHIASVSAITGDHGARHLLAGGATIECAELCSGRDVDTPEDLEAVRLEARAVL